MKLNTPPNKKMPQGLKCPTLKAYHYKGGVKFFFIRKKCKGHVVREALVSVSSLLLATVFMLLGSGMLGTLLSIRTLQDGNSSLAAGLLMSAYSLGLIIATLRVSTIISNVGHIRAFSVFASIFSAAVLAHGIHSDIYYWFVLRFIEGFCMGGFFMCTESWLNAKSNNAIRGKIFSAYMCAIYVSQGVGQFLLNLSNTQSFALLAFVSILSSIALVPVALTKVKEPDKPTPTLFSLKKLISISPLGVFICFISGLFLGGIYGLTPIYANKLGLDLSNTSSLMAGVLLGGFILQWPLGALSDRMDRRYVILLSLGACITLSFILTFITLGSWALIIITALFGGFAFSLYPLAVNHTNDFADNDDAVATSGGLLLICSTASVMGPLIGGYMITLFGAIGFPTYFIIPAAAGIAFTIYRLFFGQTLSEEDRGTYQFVPQTSVLASELANDDTE
jgi:MFS family permease